MSDSICFLSLSMIYSLTYDIKFFIGIEILLICWLDEWAGKTFPSPPLLSCLHSYPRKSWQWSPQRKRSRGFRKLSWSTLISPWAVLSSSFSPSPPSQSCLLACSCGHSRWTMSLLRRLGKSLWKSVGYRLCRRFLEKYLICDDFDWHYNYDIIFSTFFSFLLKNMIFAGIGIKRTYFLKSAEHCVGQDVSTIFNLQCYFDTHFFLNKCVLWF